MIEAFSTPSYLPHSSYASVNYPIGHNRGEIDDVVEPRYRERRSPLCKRSPTPCKKILKKYKKFAIPYTKIYTGAQVSKSTIKATKVNQGGPKLAGLTLGGPPLALLLKTKKVTSPIKGIPKLAIAGPKAVGPKAVGPPGLAALGPLALGPKAVPAKAKVLKAGPLLPKAVLKKGAGPLFPLKKKAAVGLPAVLLLSQSQGGGNQRSGGGSSSGGNRTRGTRGPTVGGRKEETTTRAPSEEEKEATLEAQAAMREAQATINEARATMQQALQGAQLPPGMQEALAALGRS